MGAGSSLESPPPSPFKKEFGAIKTLRGEQFKDLGQEMQIHLG